MPHKTPARIDLKNVTYAIDNKVIIPAMTWQSQKRRIGVVGRNGSGKTTLSRLLAGLIKPTKGTITLDGSDVAQDRKAALKHVGILFQNPEHQIIFPTVAEEIQFGLVQQGHSKRSAGKIAQETLEAFGKSAWHDVNVHALSHGQKHLLCLLSVVAMRPAVLILDEPLAGLDIPTRIQLNRYLSLYTGTIVHITHDHTDIDGYDEALWIDKGEIRRSGDVSDVLTAYETAMRELGRGDDISDIPG